MNRLLIAMLAAWLCHAQQFPRTPAEMQEQTERDLRGTFDRPPADAAPAPYAAPIDIQPRPAPQRPTGQSISVHSLLHKVPKAARQSFARARKLSHAGDHQASAAELQTAVKRDPEFAAGYNALGVEYGQFGRFAEAQAALQHALELDPNFANAHYNLAVVLLQLGDLTGAEQSVRRNLQLASENAYAHWLLGYLLLQHDATRNEGLRQVEYAAHTLKEAKQFLASVQPHSKN